MTKRHTVLVGLGIAAVFALWWVAKEKTPQEPITVEPAAKEAPAPGEYLPPSAIQPETSRSDPEVGQDYPAPVTKTSNEEHPAWPAAPVSQVVESDPDPSGVFRRVTIVQPSTLPYPVRIEEKIQRDLTTGEETLLARLEMVANHLIVKLRPNHPIDALKAAVTAIGGNVGTYLGGQRLYLVYLPHSDADGVPNAIEALSAAGLPVEYAEPDYIVRALATIPNDPDFGSLWGLNNTGQQNGLEDADIDAPEAWDIIRDAEEVIVAVIDTGVRYTHEDLAANMWVNPGEVPADGIDNDGNGYIDDVHGINAILDNGDPLDDVGHGTHVAGTIGAVGDNGIGVVGVAWKVQLMALKFLGAGGGNDSDAILCINYARTHGAHIMNNSWGGRGSSISLRDAIAAARDAGIIFVAAAGNNGSDNDAIPFSPASYDLDNVVSVGASTRQDTISDFSNFGSSSVDIAAPGTDILSTWNTSDSSYVTRSGTSMAAPL